MRLEGLARLDALAQRSSKAASDYLRELNDATDPTGYWRFCVDDACAKAANFVEWKRQRDAQRAKAGYESVVR
jgi:hypothetical protein